MLSGVSSMISDQGRPARSAAVYTIGLKVEPACRTAWTARLNLLSLKSRPPTMARSLPVRASSTTASPWR